MKKLYSSIELHQKIATTPWIRSKTVDQIRI
jgi:hypothetical protein